MCQDGERILKKQNSEMAGFEQTQLTMFSK